MAAKGSCDLDIRTRVRLILPLCALPILIIGGLAVTQYGPDSVESFYADTALPFLITYWIGLGFTNTWRLVREAARKDRTPPGVIAAVGVLSALTLLYMLGGVSALWEDPWLFGVAVAPGFALGTPLLRRWLDHRHPMEPRSAASGQD